MSSENAPDGQSDNQPDIRTIDADAAAEIVAAAAAKGDALDLIVPGVPGLGHVPAGGVGPDCRK